MKRLKSNQPSLFLVTSITLAVAVVLSNSASGQQKKPDPSQQKKEKATTEEKPKLINSLMTLDQMLSVALKHNPDIRAQRAKVIAAEAELDRARLKIVQKIIAFHKRWKGLHRGVSGMDRELRQALKDGKQSVQDLEFQQRELAGGLANLREIEIEMPFLLGQQNAVKEAPATDTSAEIIQKRLIPMLEEIVKIKIENYQMGRTYPYRFTAITDVPLRLAKLKVRTATTQAERVAVVQLHVELLKSFVEITQAKYKAGVRDGQMVNVLATKIHLAEAELWLAEVKEGFKVSEKNPGQYWDKPAVVPGF